MKKSTLLLLLSALLLTGCVNHNNGNGGGGGSGGEGGGGEGGGGGSGGSTTREGDEYDAWANEWSKPGHLYFHYNRGDKTDYDNYCLWLWQFSPESLEGSLWGYSGETKVSEKLTLKPMSTSFMTLADVGETGTGVYKDQFGVIFDVDLYNSNLVGGKTGKPTSFVGAKSVGFLLPQQKSMGGATNWTSDGGTETYIDDFSVEKNWRSVSGGKAIHVFTSTGDLDNYSYYAGSGTPAVKVNPVDSDTTGNFRSKVDTIELNNYKPKTSDAFKEVGAGYQVFVSSFRDSDGDGMGDLRGVIDSLDYFEDLGVKALWLTPIQQSGSYHGYDISDYYAVDPRYGTIEDYRELIYKAHQKGIKVLMDLVLNHTSKSNIWFQKSKWAVNSGVEGTETDDTGIDWRNVYTWKYGTDTIKKNITYKKTSESGYTSTIEKYDTITVAEDAASDNPSWYRDGESNYYYYGKFGSSMPEINYENKDTRKLVIDMAKYWMSFGLDGFRLDAVKHIYMVDEVADASGDLICSDVGSATSFDDEKGKEVTKQFDYSSDLTKNVNWWKEFSYEVKSVYPNAFLVGENFDGWGTRTSPYYQALDSQFDFSNYYHVPAWIYNSDGGASCFNVQADETYTPFGQNRSDYINGAFTSNHDVPRLINQANGVGNHEETTANSNVPYGNATVDGKAKVQAAITLLNPGCSWIYYGDELGMSSNTNTHVETYGNENCMDIWYRQPFIWNDATKRANYKSGQYKFELDTHNNSISNNGEGITYENGKVTTTNSFYKWYKDVIAIKNQYPKGAKVTYTYCSLNVIAMHVTGTGAELWIYINTGKNSDSYTMNPGSGFTNIAALGGAPTTAGGNIGSNAYSVSAFIKK